MLSLITSLPLILLLLGHSLADQAAFPAPNSALSSALSSLSSLFSDKPNPTATATPSICCGQQCAPGACDANRIIPSDLAYAFPLPTASPTASSLTLPCCHANCPDGACRTRPIKNSQRPTLTRPGMKQTSTNIIIGCCGTCKNCDQMVTSQPAESILRAAEPEITASASLVVDNDDGSKLAGSGDQGQLTDICIGCGSCRPCDPVRLATWAEFLPRPSLRDGGEETTTTTTETSTTKSTNKVDSAESSAEPTIYLAPELNDAINGRNQDMLPLIIQNGGDPDSKKPPSSPSDPETGPSLRTLLATIDLKLNENYITRRLLQQLHLFPTITSIPDTQAVLSDEFDADQIVLVNGSVVLNVVLGSSAQGNQRLFKNVRFNVHGAVDDQVVADANRGEVIVGARLLREIGGLVVSGAGVRGPVVEGVRVVERVRYGRVKRAEGFGDGEGEAERHDEL